MAADIVQSSPLYDRFIEGTPLENDIIVWMLEAVLAKAFCCRQLEHELAEANRKLDEHRDELVRRGIEMGGYITQLTAHKAALEKCEAAIMELNEDGGYLTAGSSETCCNCGHVNGHDEGCIQPIVDEALAAIKQLKQQ